MKSSWIRLLLASVITLILSEAFLLGINFDKLYRERLKKEGKNPVLYNAAARYFVVNGKLGNAEKILKKNLSNYPGDTDSIFLLAAILTRKKEYKQARKLFYTLLKEKPVIKNHIQLYTFILDKMGDSRIASKYRKVFNLTAPVEIKDDKKMKTDKLLVIMRAAISTSQIRKNKEAQIRKKKEDLLRMEKEAKSNENIEVQNNETENEVEQKDSEFSTESSLSLEEQEQLASNYLEIITELEDEVEKYRDNQSIVKNMTEIIKNAPDTEIAKNMIWKTHQLYLGVNGVKKDMSKVEELLELYLTKCKDDDAVKTLEAYGTLTECAEFFEDWEYTMYYAEQYLTIDDGNIDVRVRKAKALTKLGELEKGVDILNEIRLEDPQSIGAFKAWQILKDLGYNEDEPEQSN